MEENILASGKIGSLIKKFSIPCVISMVVAALYNIVDQIFIGWSEAGANGNAATNIVYPFTVLALGLALLIGDGAAAGFSIALGRGDKEQADRNIGNGLSMLIALAVILCACGIILRTKILALFGGDPNETVCYGYATDYYKIICIGIPFYMTGQGLNGSIRADGSPRFAMACTLAGAITNLIFDPVFIFGFKMGVKGAAIATVMGQVLTFIMSIIYLAKAKNFRISSKSMTPSGRTVGSILSLGMASLIVQVSIVIIIAVNNNLFVKYGVVTIASTGNAYGSIVPLAVNGIVMKVFGIVVSIVIGVSLGGQPIIGFNMGAGNIGRVKDTITLITKLVIGIGMVAFIIFEVAPGAVISLFGSHNTEEYMEYARLSIRIFLGGIILTCYIKSAAIILQSMGNSTKSTLLALFRDVIVFVPSTLILAALSHSVVTMLWAALISDVVSAIIGFIFVRTEIKKFEKASSGRKINDESAEDITAETESAE